MAPGQTSHASGQTSRGPGQTSHGAGADLAWHPADFARRQGRLTYTPLPIVHAPTHLHTCTPIHVRRVHIAPGQTSHGAGADSPTYPLQSYTPLLTFTPAHPYAWQTSQGAGADSPTHPLLSYTPLHTFTPAHPYTPTHLHTYTPTHTFLRQRAFE